MLETTDFIHIWNKSRDAWTSCSNETYSKTFLKLKSLLLISTILSSPLLSSQILILVFLVKHTLKTFDYFKNKQKIVSSNVFWYVKICILWEPIQYIIHCHKTQMLKKNFFGQNKWYKKYPIFSFTSPNSSQFYFWFAILIWAEAQVSSLSETVCGIFHF